MSYSNEKPWYRSLVVEIIAAVLVPVILLVITLIGVPNFSGTEVVPFITMMICGACAYIGFVYDDEKTVFKVIAVVMSLVTAITSSFIFSPGYVPFQGEETTALPFEYSAPLFAPLFLSYVPQIYTLAILVLFVLVPKLNKESWDILVFPACLIGAIVLALPMGGFSMIYRDSNL